MNGNYSKEYFKERDILILHLANTIADFAQKNTIKKILDVGCGAGKLVSFLNKSGFESFGCDFSKVAVKFARINNNNKPIIKLCSSTKLSYPDSSFDMICAISLIEHLKPADVNKFLLGATRILKPQGFIFLVTPNYSSPLRIIKRGRWFGYQDPTHVNFFTPLRLKKTLIKSGFRKTKLTFNISYQESFNKEFPTFFQKSPPVIKKILIYLLFNSPFYIMRDSFWITARKDG